MFNLVIVNYSAGLLRMVGEIKRQNQGAKLYFTEHMKTVSVKSQGGGGALHRLLKNIYETMMVAFLGGKRVSFEQAIRLSDQTDSRMILLSNAGCNAFFEKLRKKKADIRLYGVLRGDDGKFRYPLLDYTKPVLDYFEYHVAWHCNLNCKGCGHNSNLYTKPRFGDLEHFRRDMNRLTELFSNISKIRLMGGEPLLNPQLGEFITSARKAFPGAQIRVVSNGLLIPKADAGLLELMEKTGAAFDISLYPPTVKVLKEIREICGKNRVSCYVSEPVKEFFMDGACEPEPDVGRNFELCESQGCHFLFDGELSVCPAPIVARENRALTGTANAISRDDIINLYDKAIDGFQIIKKFSGPIPYCRYCNKAGKILFPWEGQYRKALERH